MKIEKKVARRHVLRALGAGGVAVTTSGALVREAAADESNDEKRKARYQPNSPHVQAFYRVNRYPAK